MRKKTTEEFVRQAIKVHSGKYDYSKTVYVDAKTKVEVTCPDCGESFWVKPNNHLRGDGCNKCRYERVKRPLCDFGINDIIGFDTKDVCYKYWRGMIRRCYDEKTLKKQPSYRGCSVCEEWKYLSNFKKWFDENYIEGYALDKDLLHKGNRVYSPQTCCFIPDSLNSLFIDTKSKRGNTPIGVHYRRKLGKYIVLIGENYERKYLGVYDSVIDAFNVYKKEKERFIREKANEYKDVISKEAYESMMNYEVEITD